MIVAIKKQAYNSFQNHRKEISFNFILCFYFAYSRSFAGSMDIESIKIAKLCKVSQKTTDKIIKNIRILIAKECEKISKMQGEIEIDESYFFVSFYSQLQAEGAKMVRGKRGSDAGKKHLCLVC